MVISKFHSMRKTRIKLLMPNIEVCIKYNVMLFGLANVPGIFQELVLWLIWMT